VSLGSLAVAAGVHPGLGGVGRTCRAWVSLVTLPEDVVKDGELVGQGQASVAGLLVSWLGGCGWGCGCCAFVSFLLLLRALRALRGLCGRLPGLLPGLLPGPGWCPAADQRLPLAV
jgi:hypothetical protein